MHSLCRAWRSACNNSDRLAPSDETFTHTSAELATAAAPDGIVLASSQLPVTLLSSVHTGTILPTTPTAILGYLKKVKDQGGRVLLKLHGSELAIENDDGTFSLTKWKRMVSRYDTVNFEPYIADAHGRGALLH